MSKAWDDIKKYPSQTGEKRREYYRRWYAKNGRKRAGDYMEAILEWQKNHPEAFSAHSKVRRALEKGTIVRSDKCTDCSEKRRLSAHHNDYNKPLEVEWLCSSCHKLRHPVA